MDHISRDACDWPLSRTMANGSGDLFTRCLFGCSADGYITGICSTSYISTAITSTSYGSTSHPFNKHDIKMNFLSLLSLLSLLPSLLAQEQNQKHLMATAIVNTRDNTSSAFQCWRLTTPFSPPSAYSGSSPGALNLRLADATNVTLVSRPAGESYGLHNAPYAQIVAYLSGLVNITVPTKPEQQSLILGGGHGLFFAMDTLGEGHWASYPGDEETVGLMIPLVDGEAPEHEVLDEKACEVSTKVA